MTKEQEFLDRLKDPVKARLKEAMQYYQTFNNKVSVVYMGEDTQCYMIDIMARTIRALTSSVDFPTVLEVFLDEPAVYRRVRQERRPPLIYRQTYFIMK